MIYELTDKLKKQMRFRDVRGTVSSFKKTDYDNVTAIFIEFRPLRMILSEAHKCDLFMYDISCYARYLNGICISAEVAGADADNTAILEAVARLNQIWKEVTNELFDKKEGKYT